jgi:PIN domain nuclease of toxin-antitoxin system
VWGAASQAEIPALLLLDTYVWLWLNAGSPDLSAKTRNTVNGSAAAGTLRIAAISLWEIALLASRGRIILGESIGLWLEGALADPGPAIDPLSP